MKINMIYGGESGAKSYNEAEASCSCIINGSSGGSSSGSSRINIKI